MFKPNKHSFAGRSAKLVFMLLITVGAITLSSCSATTIVSPVATSRTVPPGPNASNIVPLSAIHDINLATAKLPQHIRQHWGSTAYIDVTAKVAGTVYFNGPVLLPLPVSAGNTQNLAIGVQNGDNPSVMFAPTSGKPFVVAIITGY